MSLETKSLALPVRCLGVAWQWFDRERDSLAEFVRNAMCAVAGTSGVPSRGWRQKHYGPIGFGKGPRRRVAWVKVPSADRT